MRSRRVFLSVAVVLVFFGLFGVATAWAVTVTLSTTVSVGGEPYGVAVSPDGDTVYVANYVDDTVSVINASTNAVTATVSVGDGPWGVAVSPDGDTVYVNNRVNYTVSVINASTNAVTATVSVGVQPWGIAVSPDGATVYVTNLSNDNVSVINASTNAVTATVSVGDKPVGVAVSPDGATVYVTNLSNDNVSVINASTNAVTATVPVGGRPWGVAVSPGGDTVYVANSADDTVSVINASTNAVTATVAVGDASRGVAVSPDGDTVYVANSADDTVSVINASTNAVTATVSVGDGPWGVAVSPDGDTVYVANSADDTVSVLSITSPKSVTFDANSGSGSMSAQSGSSSSALTSNSFTRTGYTFTGWNTSADGSGTAYADGASYEFAADLTLYAQWAAVSETSDADSGSDSEASSSAVGDPVAAEEVSAAQGRFALPNPRRDGLLVRRGPLEINRDIQAANADSGNKAVALLGGEEVAISARTQGSQAAQFVTGKISLDIAVLEDRGVVDLINGIPALTVARDAQAALKGAGLLPNSKLQVYLPAFDGSFIEMPELEVNAEGEFEGSLAFRTSSREKPLPIGQRSIQIVGLDEGGVETVLDIPVTIAQPLPAPETNRVSGERPVLEPGQSNALSAGAPETVTVERSGSMTSMEGEGWAFTVETDSPGATPEAMSFTRDAPVAFSGEGFMPGTRADVWLFSDPTLLGTVNIQEDGTFTALFAVDSLLVPTGTHTLQIQGVGDDGFVRAANLGVEVMDPLDSPVGPVAPVGVQRFDLMAFAVSGTVVLVLAVLTVVVATLRRRRPRPIGVVPTL